MTQILSYLFSSPLAYRLRAQLAHKVVAHKKLWLIVSFRKNVTDNLKMEYEILGREIRILKNKIYFLFVWKFVKILLICVVLPLLIVYKFL